MKKFTTAVSEASLLLAVSMPQAFAQETISLTNPNSVAAPTNANNVVRFVLNLLIVIGLIMALGFLLYGAIRWIMSGGDKAAVESARNTIVAAVVGLVIIILTWVIFNLVLRLFGLGEVTTLRLPVFSNPG